MGHGKACYTARCDSDKKWMCQRKVKDIFHGFNLSPHAMSCTPSTQCVACRVLRDLAMHDMLLWQQACVGGALTSSICATHADATTNF